MTTSSLAGTELTWSYPDRTARAFVLHVGDRQVGRLHFDTATSACATAEFEGTWWRFEASASAYPAVRIHAEDADEAIGEFTACPTGGGVVEFRNGARYRWVREHVWSLHWCFRCAEQKSRVCISLESGPLVRGGKLAICAEAADREEMPVLVLLAWYLRVQDFARLSDSIIVAD